jgi:hypothetical protein
MGVVSIFRFEKREGMRRSRSSVLTLTLIRQRILFMKTDGLWLNVCVGPDGGVHRRRGKADAARAAAALRQAQGQREEQEAIRAPRRARVQPGQLAASAYVWLELDSGLWIPIRIRMDPQ